jgi:hypothetical protein
MKEADPELEKLLREEEQIDYDSHRRHLEIEIEEASEQVVLLKAKMQQLDWRWEKRRNLQSLADRLWGGEFDTQDLVNAANFISQNLPQI